MSNWYQLEVDQVAEEIKTNLQEGLDDQEATRRLESFGPNELQEGGARSAWKILWEQFTATMVLILIAAAVLSAVLGDYKDAIAIGAIVLLFSTLGFIQDYRAEQAMAALKRLATPLVRVRRSGRVVEISAQHLVPGDIILLEAGNVVPADVRISESANLRLQEAALTGESEPVEKTTQALRGADLPLGDRRSMGYMGTTVTYGRGAAIVVETGMRTELGRIASMLQTVESEQTPLQKRLDQLGTLLAFTGLGMAGLIFVLGLLRGERINDMLLTAVSVAVAVVPEGLPAVVTITLALGAQRMLRRQALIRRLPAVETLGSVTVICSDKTGTLTENRMTVMMLDVAGRRMNLSESMYQRMPSLEYARPGGDAQSPPTISGLPELHNDPINLLLVGGALANDALLVENPDTGRFQTLGDPTEGALLIAAAQLGMMKDQLEQLLPRVGEAPFDSERKRMTTVHRVTEALTTTGQSSAAPGKVKLFAEPYILFTKGAVDGLLEISSQVWTGGNFEVLDDAWRSRIQAANDSLAAQGMRVLGVAFRTSTNSPNGASADELETNLAMVGLFGMIDPPRQEVKSAVQVSRQAGIRPVMITGDHHLTACEIARQLGIIDENGSNQPVLTGQALASLSDAELESQVEHVSVYARVSPEHKLRIVRALQKSGHIVAMTGDGVNDAPALRQADIGVAMGITGTDVAKEASDMVLQDDNFATIVAAVEEGRTIYDNLRKFIAFSVAGNIGKVLVMLLAPFLGKPLPLQPLQLLWLNLLTDGLLGLGLGVEPPEKNAMRRPPYSPKANIFSGGLMGRVIWVGLLIGAIGLGIGFIYWRIDPDGNWQTMTFTTLAFAQIFQALASRSTSESFFSMGWRTNLPLLLLAFLVFTLQLAVVYLPFLQNLFMTEALSLSQLLIGIGVGSLVFFSIELEKWWSRRKVV